MFDRITERLIEGHWSEAQELFKGMNPSARELMDYLDSLEVDSCQPVELLKDWALLGFYCREYTPRQIELENYQELDELESYNGENYDECKGY